MRFRMLAKDTVLLHKAAESMRTVPQSVKLANYALTPFLQLVEEPVLLLLAVESMPIAVRNVLVVMLVADTPQAVVAEIVYKIKRIMAHKAADPHLPVKPLALLDTTALVLCLMVAAETALLTQPVVDSMLPVNCTALPDTNAAVTIQTSA